MSRRRSGISKRSEDVVADMPMSFDSPESSNIARASYDSDYQQLTVDFKRDSRGDQVRYVFPKVSLALWIEFYQAPSKGKFFQSRIKPMFVGTAV